jgi:Domain of unknown function (DUF4190)
MTYPPPGETPDPYQQSQQQGQPADPTSPYAPPSPYTPPPSSGQPYSPPPPTGDPSYGGQPYGQYGQAQYGEAQYGQAQYGQAPYGQTPYAATPYAAYPQTRTNALAIASLVCSLGGLVTCISAPVGVVLGHIAKRQIRQTGEQGEGLAVAGLWVGYILTVLGLLLIAAWVALVAFAVGSGSSN